MILIYTGNGKGKTSASVGQAVRAHGQGLRVAFVQFMKRPGQAGEQAVLQSLLGDRWHAGGIGFFRSEASRPAHQKAAADTLAFGRALLDAGEVDMLVLDESLYALGAGLLNQRELAALLDAAQARGVHVVLSGRGLPDWLAARADLITEMDETKHPWQQGLAATKGIEF